MMSAPDTDDTDAATAESLPSLLGSGRMSGCVLRLRHEASPAAAATEEASIRRGDRLRLENAARVCLLLSRSFVGFLSEVLSKPSSGGEGGALRLLSALRLDDCYVRLERHRGREEDEFGGTEGIRMQRWTLLGIDITPNSTLGRWEDPHHDDSEPSTPKQILGRLLRSVFLLGTSADPSFSEQLQLGPSVQLDESSSTLFSRLVRSQTLPISVCRLLSDMIDIGPGGRAHSPFTSFDEVIQDLDQMISMPCTLLHDSYDLIQGMQLGPDLVFGQELHGRDSQLEALENVALDMVRRPDSDEGQGRRRGLEAVLVTGSGKSALAGAALGRLSGPGRGWVVVHSAFENMAGVSSMFDSLVSRLMGTRDGELPSHHAEYVRRVRGSVLGSMGQEGLSLLTRFLPSLPDLFEDICLMASPSASSMEAEVGANNSLQLILLLSKILEAALEPPQRQFIGVCCDDLHLADKTSLSFLSEFLTNMGSLDRIRGHLLFVGIYRTEEVSPGHPLPNHLSLLRMSSNVNVTEMNLSSLTKQDVSKMLVSEMRLPRRHVAELAKVVHQRTIGHASFVVDLLNSLVNDSVITYSPEMRRHTWDPICLDLLETRDDAARLIVSNIPSLPLGLQQCLCLISCFGEQADMNMLCKLEQFVGGDMSSSIELLVELGFLDTAGPFVRFTNMIIQRAVCDGMPLEDRLALHLHVGSFLSSASQAHAHATLSGCIGHQLPLQLNVQANGVMASASAGSLRFGEGNITSISPLSMGSLHGNKEIMPTNAPSSFVPMRIDIDPPSKKPHHLLPETSKPMDVVETKLFMRVLLSYLERVHDNKALSAARKALKDCSNEKINIVKDRVRAAVGEEHWIQATLVHKRLVTNQEKTAAVGRQGSVARPVSESSSVKEKKMKSQESCHVERATSTSHPVRPIRSGLALSAQDAEQTPPSTSTGTSKPAASANSGHEADKIQKLTKLLEEQPKPGEEKDTSAWMLSLINTVSSGNERSTNDASIATQEQAASAALADAQAEDISHVRRGQLRAKKRKKSHSPPHKKAAMKEEDGRSSKTPHDKSFSTSHT